MQPIFLNHLTGGLLALGLAGAALAQEGSGDQEAPARRGEIIAAQASSTAQLQAQVRDRLPEGVDRSQVAETVRERVQRFEQLRTAYLEQHRKMLQELKGASSEVDREQIRERIRERRQEWTELARQIREQARERVEALRETLPNHGALLDQAREQAREQVRQGVEAARERGRRGLE